MQRSTAIALATGAASVLPIWRAPRAVRAALAVGAGAVGAVGAFMAARVPEAFGETRDPAPAGPATAFAVAAGAAVAGATVGGLALDRGAERFLVRHGVRRPRLVLGALGAGLSWAAEAAERRANLPS